jgi:hypothetical protein
MDPNKPSTSLSIPAEKNSVFGSKPDPGLRNWMAQRPLLTIGLPFAFESVPRNAPVPGVESIDHPISEVSHQQVTSKLPETRGRERDAPRGIQVRIADVLQQIAVRTEDGVF